MGGHKEEPPELPLLREWLSQYEASHRPSERFPVHGAAEVAIPLAEAWAERFKEASLAALGRALGVDLAEIEMGGPFFEVVAMFEVVKGAFEIGTWIRERLDEPEERRQAEKEAWRHYMWESFWHDELALSTKVRDVAFDRLVGDGTQHGIAPSLTKEAATQRTELMNAASDGLREDLALIQSDKAAGYPPEDIAKREQKFSESVEFWVQELVKFDQDPENWLLTPQQYALIPADSEGRLRGWEGATYSPATGVVPNPSGNTKAVYRQDLHVTP